MRSRLGFVTIFVGVLGCTDSSPSTDTSETDTGDTSTATSEPSETSETTETTSTSETGVEGQCGDGIVDPGEACDEGDLNSDEGACTTACEAASCGDGLIWQGEEECDDGNEDDADACGNDCTLPVCGNGDLEGDEECDDGNDEGFDGCEPSCVATTVVRVFTESAHSCALSGAGEVRCWGDNRYGSLGNGGGGQYNCPWPGEENYVHECITDPECCIGDAPGEMPGEVVDLGGKVVTMDLGAGHGCALLEGGSVRCWGNNYRGQLGLGFGGQSFGADSVIGDDPEELPPPDVNLGGATVVALVATYRSSFALTDDGQVLGWGSNSRGQLGVGTTEDAGDDPGEMPPPPAVAGGSVAQVVAGTSHVCARMDDGVVRCWGLNNYGQLGLGHTDILGDDPDELPSNTVPLDGPAVSLIAGSVHTCALLEGGELECWGRSDYGQLGGGNAQSIGNSPGEMPPAPVDVGEGEIVKLAASARNTCVIMVDGELRCWGQNEFGQLGLGNNFWVGMSGGDMPPDPTPLGAPVVDVDASWGHMCAVVQGGAVYCWGWNETGGLGQGHTDQLGDDPGEVPPPPIMVF